MGFFQNKFDHTRSKYDAGPNTTRKYNTLLSLPLSTVKAFRALDYKRIGI